LGIEGAGFGMVEVFFPLPFGIGDLHLNPLAFEGDALGFVGLALEAGDIGGEVKAESRKQKTENGELQGCVKVEGRGSRLRRGCGGQARAEGRRPRLRWGYGGQARVDFRSYNFHRYGFRIFGGAGANAALAVLAVLAVLVIFLRSRQATDVIPQFGHHRAIRVR